MRARFGLWPREKELIARVGISGSHGVSIEELCTKQHIGPPNPKDIYTPKPQLANPEQGAEPAFEHV